jgi:putative peptide zinc metalloprotease protein
MTPAKRRRFLLGAAVLVALVALIHWPRSVAGDARVLPAVEMAVRARTEGVLQRVGVQSGDRVRAGQVLASLDPVPATAKMAELRAEALVARTQSAEAEAARDPVGRRLAELRQDEAMARLAEARREGARTQLVAPVDGYVLTPALDERIGDWLEAGDVLCQVSPLDTLRVEVAVSEEDIDRIRPGQRLRIKVLGFPERQFAGFVTDVSWIGESPAPGQGSHFAVRGWVANPGPSLRAGMTGRARIDVEGATLLWRMTRGLVRMFRLNFWI